MQLVEERKFFFLKFSNYFFFSSVKNDVDFLVYRCSGSLVFISFYVSSNNQIIIPQLKIHLSIFNQNFLIKGVVIFIFWYIITLNQKNLIKEL
ncbi:hypothetical protein C0971_02145 [Bacillus methanolicus]|nr:hypothetical protein C0971_02145 [Bacillus methanolicus]